MRDVTIYHQAVDDRRRELLGAAAQRRLARAARRASGHRTRAGRRRGLEPAAGRA